MPSGRRWSVMGFLWLTICVPDIIQATHPLKLYDLAHTLSEASFTGSPESAIIQLPDGKESEQNSDISSASGQRASKKQTYKPSEKSSKGSSDGSDFNDEGTDGSDEGGEPPPSQKPASADQTDATQLSVDQLVGFSAIGDVESVTGIINAFGTSLLFGLHSQSGDSALHAAVRNNQAATVQAIDEISGDKKELLWTLKNSSGHTPGQLRNSVQETGCEPRERSEEAVGISTAISEKSSEAELLDASASGNVERVQALVAKGVSPSARNDHKRTPLHLAAQHGHTELVAMFVNLSLSDGTPYTPMHSAAEGGVTEIMDLLIAHYKDVNARSAYQLTAMHMASLGGHVPAMEWLLDKGAEVMPRDEHGRTPMHLAAAEGHVPAMEWLLDKGAKVMPRDEQGLTLIHLAAAGGHVPAMEWLLDKDAEVMPRDEQGLTPMHLAAEGGHVPAMEWLLDKGAEVMPRDEQGLTPMHLAAAEGHVLAMKWLLDKGAEVMSRDEDGQTPMHFAAAEGHVPVMEWLLDKGADVGVHADYPHWRWTPLSDSCFSGHLEATKWLLGHGADMSIGRNPFNAAARGGHVNLMVWLKDNYYYRAISPDGWTAMHSAALGNQVPAMEWLLTQEQSVKTNDKKGITPMYAAAMVGSLDAMKWLEEKGADVMIRTKIGRTLMHAAAASGDVPTMEWLLSKGVCVNDQAKNSDTPLHAAIKGDPYTVVLKSTGNLDAMKWLLDHGADISTGKHPYFTAIRGGNFDIIRWLEASNYRVERSADGWTPMHESALGSDTDVMQHLLEQGGDVNAIDRNGLTPMCIAAKQGNLDAIKWLYDHGSIYRRGAPHPFLLATRHGNVEVMNWLVKHGLRFRRTHDGWTPMHEAAFMGQIPAMKCLLPLGDDVNAVNPSNHTPLYAAARGGNLEAIKWLLDHGADITKGVPPVRAAKQSGHPDVQNWFRSYQYPGHFSSKPSHERKQR